MPFILQGRLFELNPLSPEIDEEFRSLYNAFLGSGQYDLARFSESANNFFDTYPSDTAKHDAYFTNFSLLWRHTLNAGNVQTAEHLWEIALAPAFAWEAKRPQARVHKGTAFYFRGMTAVMRGELDRGYALMHQALGEDVLSHQTDVPDTPAYALVTMNSQKIEQAFRSWVLQKAAIVARFIDQYCSVNKSAFTLRQFQDRFLLHPPSRETAFLFAYVIGRLVKLEEIPLYAKENDFVSQLQLNLLFDLALVLDAAIAHHHSSDWRFIQHATFLSTQCSLGTTLQQFQSANGDFTTDFSATMQTLLENSYVFKDGNQPGLLSRDLIVAYGIRNRGAHNISSILVIRQHFAEILQALLNSLFLTVETFY